MSPDQPTSLKPDLIGVLFNHRYELQETIGFGGMGAVYKGHDTLLKRDVAVKVLSAPYLNETHHARLMREAQATASLNHPNIVSVYDVGEHEGFPFIVMELVQGKSLDKYMPVSLKRALSLSIDICQALKHAHNHGVIHRDIKPENVLITDQEEITKLVDFGLAYKDASRITQEGEILGTLYFTAPEQITGSPIDQRTDLYALDILMYELITNELPFSADNPITMINHHLHTNPDPPCLKAPLISSGLNDLILRLLMKSPEDRPDSASEVIQTLISFIAEETETSAKVKESPKYRLDKSTPVHFGMSVQNQIRTWKDQGQSVLDAPSMALLLRYPQDVTFDEDDLVFVLKSALHLEMELEPWMNRAVSSKAAIGALVKLLDEYPKPVFRQRIVDALVRMKDKDVVGILLKLVKEEDYHQVRSTAAVEASRWGYRDTVLSILQEDIQQNNDPSALAALVAVADEIGLPQEFGPYPRFQVLYALFQRRWKKNRSNIRRFAMRGGLGTGLFTLVLGLFTPLYTYWLDPVGFNNSTWPVHIWSLVGGTSTFVIGWIQGYITYLMRGIAEIMWPRSKNRWRCLLVGGIAGLFFGLYEIFYIALDLFAKPQISTGFFVPLLLLFGYLIGIGLACVIPPFKGQIQRHPQFLTVLSISLLLTGLAVPFYWLIYLEFRPAVIYYRLFFVFLTSIGAGLNPFRIKEDLSG